MVENRTGKKLKTLRSDNGTEYTDGAFKEFCDQEGIVRHWTVRKTPQQNGVAERLNRTLREKSMCMRSYAGLGKEWWAESIATARYIVNRSPHVSLDGDVPYKVWSGKHADYGRLRIFGCTAYYHVDEGKLDAKAKKAIFLGYATGVKGYRLWSIDDSKFVISRDVTFDEDTMVASPKANVTGGYDIETSKSQVVEIEPKHHPGSSRVQQEDHGDTHDEDDGDEVEYETLEQENMQAHEQQQFGESLASARPKRAYKHVQKLGSDKPLKHYGQVNAVEYALSVEEDEPIPFKEAIRNSNSESCLAAMKEEMKSLQRKQTWDLVSLPAGSKFQHCLDLLNIIRC